MAVNIHIKIGDIKGGSKDKDFADYCDVDSFSFGLTQMGGGHRGGGSGAGKVNIQDLSFVKPVDRATPNLMKACAQGDHIKEVLLSVRKAGGKKPVDYVKMKLEQVLITGVSAGTSQHDETPLETVSLNFVKVTYEYQPQKDDGSPDGGAISFKYDVKRDEVS